MPIDCWQGQAWEKHYSREIMPHTPCEQPSRVLNADGGSGMKVNALWLESPDDRGNVQRHSAGSYQLTGQQVHLSKTLTRVSVSILRVCNKTWCYEAKWEGARLAQSGFLSLPTQILTLTPDQKHWQDCLFRLWTGKRWPAGSKVSVGRLLMWGLLLFIWFYLWSWMDYVAQLSGWLLTKKESKQKNVLPRATI